MSMVDIHVDKFYYSDNMFVFPSQILRRIELRNLYERLASMMKEGFNANEYNICMYPDCDHYTAMYVNDIDSYIIRALDEEGKSIQDMTGPDVYDSIKFVNDNLVEKVVSVLSLTHVKTKLYPHKPIVEIYDVYTIPAYRRKHIASKLLGRVIDLDEGEHTMWLGVKVNEENCLSLVAMYSKLGFSLKGFNPGGISPGGLNFGVSSFSMMLEKDYYHSLLKMEVHDRDAEHERRLAESITYAEKLIHEYNHLLCVQTYTLYLSRTLAFTIRKLVEKEPVEYGGELIIKTFEDKIVIAKNTTISEGTMSSIHVHAGWVTWHTHPLSSMHEVGYIIGWPSGRDMAWCIELYDIGGGKLHLIFSPSGIYFLQMTTNFMKFWEYASKECKERVKDIIEEKYRNYETQRKYEILDAEVAKKELLFQNSEKKEQLASMYMAEFMNFTYDLLIADMPDRDWLSECRDVAYGKYDFGLFLLTHIDWDQIERTCDVKNDCFKYDRDIDCSGFIQKDFYVRCGEWKKHDAMSKRKKCGLA